MGTRGKEVLVTGGAGYAGSVLVRSLLSEGYYVTCLDHLRFGGESLFGILKNERFRFFNCDITDRKNLKRVFRNRKYDAVVHLAAIVGDPACRREPELARKTNWVASKNLLDLARDNGSSRFLFASTCSNYGKMPDPDGYVDEQSPLAPVSLYAELKVRFEETLLSRRDVSNGFSPTSLRFATIYGISPRMRFDLTVNEFTKELVLGRELAVYGENFWRPYCHVEDYARAILAVLKAPKRTVAYEVFNIGNTRENYTKKMIVDLLKRMVKDAKVKYTQIIEDPRDYKVSFKKLEQALGFDTKWRMLQGVREMKEILQMGIYPDTEDKRFYNIPV